MTFNSEFLKNAFRRGYLKNMQYPYFMKIKSSNSKFLPFHIYLIKFYI